MFDDILMALMSDGPVPSGLGEELGRARKREREGGRGVMGSSDLKGVQLIHAAQCMDSFLYPINVLSYDITQD